MQVKLNRPTGWMSTAQYARLIGQSERVARRWIANGWDTTVEAKKFGKNWKVRYKGRDES